MGRSIPALVTPKLLRFGRESIGLSIDKVATKLSIPSERLIDWEEGRDCPPMSKFRDLAKAYKRSEAFFYLPDIPEPCKKRVADFRSLPKHGSLSPVQPSTEFLCLMKDIEQRHTIALELLDELDEDPAPHIPESNLKEEPEVVAQRIRSVLQIEDSKQFRWSKSYEALAAWISSIEQLGVLVFKSSRSKVPLEEMRGLAIWDESLPVITLNSKDTDNGKIFSLMHELVHLSLHTSGVSQNSTDEDLINLPDIEVFCNHVAGAILVPETTLLEHPVITLPRDCNNLSDDEIFKIARKFCVSAQVILRRLLIFNRISKSFYTKKYHDFSSQPTKKKTGGGVTVYAKQVVSREGRLFPRIVLRAMHEDKISIGRASSYLNTKVKHFKDLEEIVF